MTERTIKTSLGVLAGTWVLLFLMSSPDSLAGPKEDYEEGVRHLQAEDFDAAIASFGKVNAVNANIAQVHNLLGIAYLEKKGAVGNAVHELEEAIRLDPSLADAYNNLAIVYSGHILDLELAEEYFKKAIEKNPSFGRAYFGLGWLYMTKKQDIEGSMPFLEKAVEFSPEHMEAHYFLGIGYIAMGDRHKALRPISVLRTTGRNDLAQTLEAMIEQDSTTVRQKVSEQLQEQQQTSSEGGAGAHVETLDSGKSPVPWL